MKKIIATVLAMVMALALCTTAFAAALASDKHIEDANATAATIGSVSVDGYWLGTTATLNNTGKVIVAKVVTGHDTYWSAVKSADDDTEIGIYYVWDKDTNKFVQITDAEKAVIVKGYTDTKLIVKEIAGAATCTDDGYNCAVYTNLDETAKYVKVADIDAFNAKQTKSEDKMTYSDSDVVYFGSKFSNAVAYVPASIAGNALAAGHILVKDGTTYGTAKADVYKCAICGNRYVTVLNSDTKTLKSERYTYDNSSAVAAYANANGIVSSKLLKSATTLYLVEAGTATTTPSTGNTTSPKTFDAGIAMYVGMALTSVAGSAVVIGKKKEF